MKWSSRRVERPDASPRDLFRREVNAVADEAVRSGGDVPSEKLEALGRLARLVDLFHAAQPASRRKRWPVAAAFGATLLITSILLFARVRSTDIELDVTASEVSFTLPEQQELTAPIAVAALGVSGVRAVQIPSLARQVGTTNGDDALLLSIAAVGSRQGTIDLRDLVLPMGTRVTLQSTGMPRQFRLILEGPPAAQLGLQASVNGPVRFGFAGGSDETFDLPIPKAVVLESASDHLALDVTFSRLPAAPFTRDLVADALRLARVEEFADTQRTVVRRASTILSWTLYFGSLNGQAQKLRAGERIELAQSRGEIHALELRDDGIALRFGGEVRGMSDGSATTRWSLMPTCLAWLQARQGLSLLWGTGLYLFGLVAGAMRWWRGVE